MLVRGSIKFCLKSRWKCLVASSNGGEFNSASLKPKKLQKIDVNNWCKSKRIWKYGDISFYEFRFEPINHLQHGEEPFCNFGVFNLKIKEAT